MESSILQINEGILTNESTEHYEYHEYSPITGTDLNKAGEIGMVIETQDLFTLPCKSYLVFEGQFNKNIWGRIC